MPTVESTPSVTCPGLADRPVVDELEVVATTLADGGRPPAHLEATQWSSRLLGEHLGISFATVARVWRKWGTSPDRVETFTLSTDLKRPGPGSRHRRSLPESLRAGGGVASVSSNAATAARRSAGHP